MGCKFPRQTGLSVVSIQSRFANAEGADLATPGLSIFPHSLSGNVTVNSVFQIEELQVVDFNGNVVLSGNPHARSCDLRGWQAGCYNSEGAEC